MSETNMCSICRKPVDGNSLYCDDCKLDIEIERKEMTLEM